MTVNWRPIAILGWLLLVVMFYLAYERDEQSKKMAMLDPTPASVPCGVQPKPEIYHPWQQVPKEMPDHRKIA